MIIKENLMGNAYMLDKYEDLIKVKYHPYGYEDDIEENSSCAYFLYKFSKKNKDKINKLLLNYIAYCFYETTVLDIQNYFNINIIDKEFTQIFKHIFDEFDISQTLNAWNIYNNKQEVFNDLLVILKDSNLSNIEDIYNYYNEYEDNNIAYMQLNEDYTRVRIGGRYDNNSEDCIYFRISSVGYNWGDIIVNVVFNNFMNVKYITIERDTESANINKQANKIYKTKDGQSINHMLVKDFVYQEHIPLVASLTNNKLYSYLMENKSILDIRNSMPISVIKREYRNLIKEQLDKLN